VLYLDSNVFIVYLTNTPEHQGSQTHAFFRELAIGAIVATTSEGVLVEVTQVLASKKGLAYPRALISQELKKFLDFRGLRLENLEVHLRALDRFGATNLDYVDCILIESANGPDDAIVSFDRDYDRVFPGMRAEPETVLQQPVRPDTSDLAGHQENEEPA
jgi:predicted nucleic acid-binding protein